MSLDTRKDAMALTSNIKTDQIYPSCRLLSRIIGMPIWPYEPIVGRNAFAHESGIHQDGVLKNRQTYEIMTPQSVGRAGTEMVLGKHSGRAAVAKKCEELGFRMQDEEVKIVFDAIKNLADRKERIFDEDVEAIILEEVFRKSRKYALKNMSVFCGNAGMPPSAAVIMTVDDEEKRATEFGNGPIDALFTTINTLVGQKPKLQSYMVNAVTRGIDAQGEVTVRLEQAGLSTVGRGSDEDVIVASAKAYINALNRLAMKMEEKS
jgi:2-isopropylmalate synthase